MLSERLKATDTCEVLFEIPDGLSKQEILERIEQGDISLTLLGTQGRRFMGGLGSAVSQSTCRANRASPQC